MVCLNTRYKGFLLTEIIVSLTVLSILLVGLAVSLGGFRRFNRYQLIRQRCTAAAQAQIDSITVTGRSIPKENFERLWPGLDVLVEDSAGPGQWQGTRLLQVTVKSKGKGRLVTVGLCRYIGAKQEH